jgi:hypothetical protein
MAWTRYLDRQAVSSFTTDFAFEPYPFNFPCVQLQARTFGYMDRGKNGPGRAAPLLVGLLFLPMAGLVSVLAMLSGVPVAERVFVLGLAVMLGALSWIILAVGRHQSKLVRVLAYSETRSQIAIVMMRGRQVVHRVCCDASQAKLMIHKTTFEGGRGTRKIWWGSGFVLAVYVGGERFVIAAQGKKEQLLDLWPQLPVWLKKVDAGEGEALVLTGDRKVF